MSERVCKEYSEKLVLYRMGELSAPEAAEVEAHAASCGACRAELAALSAAMDGLPKYAPRQGEVYSAVEGVMKRIDTRRRPLARRLIPALITAAAVTAAVIAVDYMPRVSTHKAPTGQVATTTAPQAGQVSLANTDWELLENMDVIADLDVIEQMDDYEEMVKELGNQGA